MKPEDIENMPAGRSLDFLIAERVMHEDVMKSQFAPMRYSTDIADAWQVVEKLREQGFPLHIQCLQNPQNPYGVAGYHDLRTDAWIWADTAPLAICRAALKAVSQENEK
jgi:Phage ABA sandwich domain